MKAKFIKCNIAYLHDIEYVYFSEQGNSTFPYFPYKLWWSAAKLLCDCYGHLAVVDTPEKQIQLLEQV